MGNFFGYDDSNLTSDLDEAIIQKEIDIRYNEYIGNSRNAIKKKTEKRIYQNMKERSSDIDDATETSIFINRLNNRTRKANRDLERFLVKNKDHDYIACLFEDNKQELDDLMMISDIEEQECQKQDILKSLPSIPAKIQSVEKDNIEFWSPFSKS
jgi:hypothetical protein